MKKDGKFRFTIQFAAGSEDQIRVGEFLERLGNKKSTILIEAMREYLNAHPELEGFDGILQVRSEHSYSQKEIESIVRSIIGDSMRFSKKTAEASTDGQSNQMGSDLENDIGKMLDNLDSFL